MSLGESMLYIHHAIVIEKTIKQSMRILAIHIDLWLSHNKTSEKISITVVMKMKSQAKGTLS